MSVGCSLNVSEEVTVTVSQTDSAFHVALPLLSQDWRENVYQDALASLQKRSRERAQLIVYPELMSSGEFSGPEMVREAIRFAKEHGIPTVDGGWLREDDEDQIAAVLASPKAMVGQPQAYLYRKHSQSARIAFDNPDWISRFEDIYLRPVPCGNRSIGLTLCHDQTISPLQRSLVRRGANLLVNPSFGEVTHSKWELWLRARAIENGTPIVSTMWAALEGRTGYVFAYGPRGESLPLEFVPTKPRAKEFVVESSAETVPRHDGYYLAHVPPALDRPDVPPADDRGPIRSFELVGIRSGKREATAKVSVGGDPVGLGAGAESTKLLRLGDRTIIAVLVRSSEIFEPEACARALLRADRAHSDVKKPYFIIVNAWGRLPSGHHGEVLRVVAAARALEHGVVALVVGLDGLDPIEGFSSTLYRVSRRLDGTAKEVEIELDANALQCGGPRWFFSCRQQNDFSKHRIAYEALLESCDQSARAENRR